MTVMNGPDTQSRNEIFAPTTVSKRRDSGRLRRVMLIRGSYYNAASIIVHVSNRSAQLSGNSSANIGTV